MVYKAMDILLIKRQCEMIFWKVILIKLLFAGKGYPHVIFTLHLKRRNKFYMMNIVLPCIMLSVLIMIGKTIALPSLNKLISVIIIIGYQTDMINSRKTPFSSENSVLRLFLWSCLITIVSAPAVPFGQDASLYRFPQTKVCFSVTAEMIALCLVMHDGFEKI